MLRTRDILALVGVVILVRTTWNSGLDSLSAAVDLAFFFPREGLVALAPFDVDGDGILSSEDLVKILTAQAALAKVSSSFLSFTLWLLMCLTQPLLLFLLSPWWASASSGIPRTWQR